MVGEEAFYGAWVAVETNGDMVTHRKKLTPKKNRNSRGRGCGMKLTQEEPSNDNDVQGKIRGLVPENHTRTDYEDFIPWRKDPLPDNYICR